MKKTVQWLMMAFLLPIFAEAGHKWVVLYAAGLPYEAQGYAMNDSWDKMAYKIEERWAQGYNITNLVEGYGVWVSVYAKATGITNQSYVSRRDRHDFIDAMKRKFKEGWSIQDLTYGDGAYAGLFVKKNDKNKTSTYVMADYFKPLMKKISEKWNEGYAIDFIRYYEGNWFAFFKKGKGEVQRVEQTRNWSNFADIIAQRWKEGFYLTDLHFGFDLWTGTFTKTDSIKAQAYDIAGSWGNLHDKIARRWKDGYQIQQVSGGW